MVIKNFSIIKQPYQTVTITCISDSAIDAVLYQSITSIQLYKF